MPMLEGFIYEPRAFWSFGRITLQTATARPPNVVRLNREHFYNGEKYPITLLYACVAPLNYVFDQYAEGAAATTQAFRNDGVAQLDWGQLRVAARQRQHYAKIAMPTQGFIPRPTWEPRAGGPDDPSGTIGATVSSLYNVYRWDYDAPMVIPVRGDLEYELSSWLYPGSFSILLGTPFAQIGFTEVGTGPWGSQMRVSPRFPLVSTSNPVSWQGGVFPADGFGAQAIAQGTPMVWPPAQQFRARQFAAQNMDSDGSIPLTRCSVVIDQRAYDATVLTQMPGAATTSLVASMGTRIAARARTRHGGTGAWWWRDGAPLALVSPSSTPAQVFELRRPITLGPGDSLEVELTFPTAPTVGQESAFSINQLGVSFCGHACIEA